MDNLASMVGDWGRNRQRCTGLFESMPHPLPCIFSPLDKGQLKILCPLDSRRYGAGEERSYGAVST